MSRDLRKMELTNLNFMEESYYKRTLYSLNDEELINHVKEHFTIQTFFRYPKKTDIFIEYLGTKSIDIQQQVSDIVENLSLEINSKNSSFPLKL